MAAYHSLTQLLEEPADLTPLLESYQLAASHSYNIPQSRVADERTKELCFVAGLFC